jgi:hypothetical protein
LKRSDEKSYNRKKPRTGFSFNKDVNCELLNKKGLKADEEAWPRSSTEAMSAEG